MRKRILAIIPAYNESDSIAEVISETRRLQPGIDILVVNDGSTDNTGELAKETGITVLDHPFNLGIGATMQTGYRFAEKHGYDIAIQLDGDGQHPPDQLENLITPVTNERADMVIGSRFHSKEYSHVLTRWVGMVIFAKIVSTITGEKLTDTTSGFRAVNSKVIAFFCGNYPDDYPEVEALVLLHKAGFHIEEVPARIEERKGGVSSISFLGGIYYMTKVILAVFIDLLKKVERV
ncbi:MAG: glycosyltransferase family 2 protein [Nitrospinota bacterium]